MCFFLNINKINLFYFNFKAIFFLWMLECFLGHHDHNHEHNEKDGNDHHSHSNHHHNEHEIVPKQIGVSEISSPKTISDVKTNKKKKNFLRTIKSK